MARRGYCKRDCNGGIAPRILPLGNLLTYADDRIAYRAIAKKARLLSFRDFCFYHLGFSLDDGTQLTLHPLTAFWRYSLVSAPIRSHAQQLTVRVSGRVLSLSACAGQTAQAGAR